MNNPWRQHCPICGRDECAWHERGGRCDGEPRKEWPLPDVRSVEELHALAEELISTPTWWVRAWRWLTSW